MAVFRVANGPFGTLRELEHFIVTRLLRKETSHVFPRRILIYAVPPV